MGRKPKIIPPIPASTEQIVDSIFAKNKAKRAVRQKAYSKKENPTSPK